MRFGFALIVAAVLWAGCTRDNPSYCESDTECDGACDLLARECVGNGASDAAVGVVCDGPADCSAADAPVCGVEGRCRGCAATQECASLDPAAPICADDGRCVACLVAADCSAADAPICGADQCRGCEADAECAARDVALPICGAAGACVQCRDHGDCPSGACDRAAQTCIEASSIVYVDPDALEDAEGCGAQGDPCKRLMTALGEVARMPEKHTLVAAAGQYKEDVDIADLEVKIIGPGAELRPESVERPALRVGDGATVAIDGFAFRGAITGDGPDGDGVQCAAADSSVRLVRVVVRDNKRTGVNLTGGCGLHLEDSRIADNDFKGVYFEGGSATVVRTRIEGNLQGGLQLRQAAGFVVVNNVIVGNGTAGATGSLVGGAVLDQGGALRPPGEPAERVFAFNTVTQNRARTAADASGVSCELAGPVTVTGNIVYANDGGVAPVSGACAWTYSDVQGGREGIGNIDAEPMFVNPGAGDFHLGPGSPCEDAADPAATLADDIDGDPRPNGPRHDIGADERS